ncbi:MAG: excisionase family DNA-binding protein [Acidobacteriota bacterium]
MPYPQNGLSISHEELVERFMTLRGKERAAEFISVTEAAETADCSRDAVLKWINEGKVEAIKVSGKFRIWRPTLQQHLRQES